MVIDTSNRVKMLTIDAMFIALIIILTFVPYVGYITIGPISFTIIHIPVLVGAILFGWKRGLLYGFVFGLFSLFKALTQPVMIDYFFIYPWISVLPRMIFGLAAGLVYQLIYKVIKKPVVKGATLGVTTFLLSLFHTFIVLSFLWLFYHTEIDAILQTTTEYGGFVLLSVVGTGALVEAGVAAAVILALTPLLFKIKVITKKKPISEPAIEQK